MGESNAETRLARILDAQAVLAGVAATLGPDLDIDEVLSSYLAVPLVCLGETIGALQIDSKEIDAFDNAAKYGHEATVVITDDGAIEVLDRGPGIADDVKESLFELFTRGRATTDIPGLGLGLPVARTLVAAMGAR